MCESRGFFNTEENSKPNSEGMRLNVMRGVGSAFEEHEDYKVQPDEYLLEILNGQWLVRKVFVWSSTSLFACYKYLDWSLHHPL